MTSAIALGSSDIAWGSSNTGGRKEPCCRQPRSVDVDRSFGADDQAMHMWQKGSVALYNLGDRRLRLERLQLLELPADLVDPINGSILTSSKLFNVKKRAL